MNYKLLFILILINIFSFSCKTIEDKKLENKIYKNVPTPKVSRGTED